jgi:rubredoxin
MDNLNVSNKEIIMKKRKCLAFSYVYDLAVGFPDAGIAMETLFEQLSEGCVCPLCGAPKSAFEEE